MSACVDPPRYLAVFLTFEGVCVRVRSCLQPEHPAAPRNAEGWKSRYWTLFQARHQKWGREGGSKAEPAGTKGKGASKAKAAPLAKGKAGAPPAKGKAAATRAVGAKAEFKMEVLVRFRPSVGRPGQTEAAAAYGDNDDDETMFLPLHQRLQLERMGHDTLLEQEVHARMAGGGKGKTLAQQKKDRAAKDSETAAEPAGTAGAAPAGGGGLAPPMADLGGCLGGCLFPKPARATISAEVPGAAPALVEDEEAAAPPAKAAEEPEAVARTPAMKHPTFAAPAAAATAAAATAGDGAGVRNGAADGEAGLGEDRPRQTFRARVVNVEEQRVLVNLPGAGLRYFNFGLALQTPTITPM